MTTTGDVFFIFAGLLHVWYACTCTDEQADCNVHVLKSAFLGV